MMDAQELEEARIQALTRYGILDTPAEEAFDRFTRLAAAVLDMPIALVSLIDRDRQWFKSKFGIEVDETPRKYAFCDHAIREDGLMVVEDALKDARFRDNPYVTGDPAVRFYAGAPLTTDDGHNLGTLCVIDTKPRSLKPHQRQLLKDISDLVMESLELRRITVQTGGDLRTLQRHMSELEFLKRQVDRQSRVLVEVAEHNHQARLAAEKVLEQRALFIASMAHELRTPLNAIIGFSELLATAGPGMVTEAKRQEWAGHIHSGGHFLLSLINDFLDLSKIEAGKFRVDRELVDLKAQMVAMVHTVSGLAKDSGVDLRFETDGGRSTVLADPRALKQIALNLLSNAIKFTPMGGTVVLSIKAEEAGCRVAVTDSGCGMSPEDLQRVMKPYEQVRGGRHGAGVKQGTGLGLSITAELLKLHGSRLELSSDVGKGTTAGCVLGWG